MGLACPVCEVPHPDGEHLADHVALTAMTRPGEHRAWLDEHAPDWEERTRADLGELVEAHAEEVDSIDLHEEVESHRHGEHGVGEQGMPESASVSGELDAEARAIVEEARRMAERKSDGEEE